MLPKSNAILVGWYSLHIITIVFLLVAGSVSVLQIFASILSLIVVLALTSNAGRWAAFTALIYSGLLTIVGIGIFVSGLWSIMTPVGIVPEYVLFGLALATMSVWTVLVFRQKLSNHSQSIPGQMHSHSSSF